MNWFDDDPFEDIFKEFFGESSKTKNYRDRILENEEDERFIDYAEDEKNVYFIFELPGYNENDVSVIVKDGKINVKVQKKDTGDVQAYLNEKLVRGVSIIKKLPQFIKTKNFSQTMKNGILEVTFIKK